MSGYALPKPKSPAGSIDHVLALIDAYDNKPSPTKTTASTRICTQLDEEVADSLTNKTSYLFAIVWRKFHHGKTLSRAL